MGTPQTSDEWRVLRGQDFTPADAREASDFGEVLANAGLEPQEAYEMFKTDNLSVGKRLFFAEMISTEQATLMLILDPDEKIRGVIDHRLREERKEENGGIIIATH